MTKTPTLLPYRTINNLVPLMPAATPAKRNISQVALPTSKANSNSNIKSIKIKRTEKPDDLLKSLIQSCDTNVNCHRSSNLEKTDCTTTSQHQKLSNYTKMPSSISAGMHKNISFKKPSDEDIQAYDLEIVKAIRSNNVDHLRKLWDDGNGKSMDACNQFGESVLHMACRRGYAKIVDFLLREARVRSDRCDDFGRNPFHDALWTSTPNFDVADLLIKYADPLLMLSEDVRGNTPFAYARREHNDRWITFLTARKNFIVNRIKKQNENYGASCNTTGIENPVTAEFGRSVIDVRDVAENKNGNKDILGTQFQVVG